MNYFLVNGRVVTPYQVLPRGGIHVRGTQIQRVFSMSEAEVPADSQAIDVHGATIAPGFIDLHLHGGGNADVMDGTVEALATISRVHAAGGATAIVPSTLTSSPQDLARAIAAFAAAKAHPADGARLLGLHLEGPYFAETQRGAQDPRYIHNPDPDEYLSILDRSPDIIRVSAAPELPGALELGRELRKRDILASIGHSDAAYQQVVAAVEAGYSHVTHLYSGMSGVRRMNCYRVPGIIESALLLDDLTVEIIADGKHLPGPLLQLIYKCKGPERIALCSDAIRAASMPDGEYLLGSGDDGQKMLIEDDVAWMADRSAFAGSVATAASLVRNMVELAGVPLPAAVKMATVTPARILGLNDRLGSLDPGKEADITILGADFTIKATIVAGRFVYDNLH